MLVVRGNARVIVPGHARYAEASQQGHGLVWPGSITHEVAEVVRCADALLPTDVGQDRLQGGQVGVDVGDESVSHVASDAVPPRVESILCMTTADAGQASANSTEPFTAGGTWSRVMQANPRRGKYCSA